MPKPNDFSSNFFYRFNIATRIKQKTMEFQHFKFKFSHSYLEKNSYLINSYILHAYVIAVMHNNSFLRKY
jgi:hypothetical protein